jgi:hypothetical protein
MSNPSPEDKNTFTLSTIKYPPVLALMVEVGRFLRPRELVIGMFPLLPPALFSTRNSFSSFTSFPYGFFLLFSAIPYHLPHSFILSPLFVCLFVFSLFLCYRPFCFHVFPFLPSFSPIPPLARFSFFIYTKNLFCALSTPLTSLHHFRIYFSFSVYLFFGWLIFVYLPSFRTGIFFIYELLICAHFFQEHNKVVQ